MKKVITLLSVSAIAVSTLLSGCISVHRESDGAATTTRSTTVSTPGASTTTTTHTN